jgi:hypothetical protein
VASSRAAECQAKKLQSDESGLIRRGEQGTAVGAVSFFDGSLPVLHATARSHLTKGPAAWNCRHSQPGKHKASGDNSTYILRGCAVYI